MGRGAFGSPRVGGPVVHEQTLPPTAQAVIEGRPHMIHALRQLGGVLLDQIHHGHRQLSVPERSGPARKAQRVSLPGPGVPSRSCTCRASALPREA